MTVKDLYGIIDSFAPFEAAESYDNVGILLGSENNEITSVAVCLDVTNDVIDFAEKIGANTIVSHHPIMFRSRKNVREDDPEGRLISRLIRKNINLIVAHTSFDNAEFGVSYRIAEHLGLTEIETILPGVKMGILPHEMDFDEFCRYLGDKFGAPVRGYGPRCGIKKVALCGGAGGEFFADAMAAGADAYVTGEMRYHDSLEAAENNMASFTVGHDSSELVAIGPLADMIREKAENTVIVAYERQ